MPCPYQKGATVAVPIGIIHEDPDQVRQKFDEKEIIERANNMRRFGQTTPGKAYWVEALQGLMLLGGALRLRAAKMAGLETYLVTICEPPANDAERIAAQLSDNLQTRLDDLEWGIGFLRMMKANPTLTQAELHRQFGFSEARISRSVTLARYLQTRPDVAKAYEEGRIRASTIVAIASEKDREVQKALLNEAMNGGLTIAEVNAKRNGHGRTPKHKTKRTFPPYKEKETGIRIELTANKATTDAQIHQALLTFAQKFNGGVEHG